MTKRMLVDATHPEETRVVVVSGNRLEELDFEIATRKQLKGNIYLAKVTRVEPSLQAAFVEYGGNRHGFLAFSEIHPDYYRIPMADRDALVAQDRQAEEDEDEDQGINVGALAEAIRPIERVEHRSPMPSPMPSPSSYEDGGPMEAGEAPDDSYYGDENGVEEHRGGDDRAEDAGAEDLEVEDLGAEAGGTDERAEAFAGHRDSGEAGDGQPQGQSLVEGAEGEGDAGPPPERLDVVGGDDVEEVQRRRPRPIRSYKIQEVIKRRQVMLVQVTKEERGNKGAALTTYLSLPGRYCVLMPNTGRGGGISRKITNPADRKRLKEILSELDIPEGMAVILRTAGLERSKQEIKRDLEYLVRLWDDIREQTLKSSAPALIYEEANLIKRAIRDVYSNEIAEVWVEGDEGYRTAMDFMGMLMPSHTRRIQLYKDESIPLFHRYQVESQIDAIHSPVVQLRSGGYIVINPTEALVAIDVNSGKSTRERNIEETAVKTNLEAADEVARQLRLRDLAGLIVIDFIDMEDNRNNAAVERRLKEAMKNDRARIQLGRVSPFGLLELSRQRLRPSLVETNFERCPHCAGTGVIRSVESASLHVLRAIEEEGIRKRSAEITVHVPIVIALYILNQKRGDLARIEERYGFSVELQADDTLIAPDLRLERIKARLPGDEGGPLVSSERIFAETDRALAQATPVDEVEEEEEEGEATDQPAEAAERVAGEAAAEADRGRRRRRRGRGRGRDGRDGVEGRPVAAEGAPEGGPEGAVEDGFAQAEDGSEGEEAHEAEGEEAAAAGERGESAEARRRRRRGRRGGRRRMRDGEEGTAGTSEEGVEAQAGDNTESDQPSFDGENDGAAEGGAVAPAAPVAPRPLVRPPAPVEGPVPPLELVDFDLILDGAPPPEAPAPVEVAPVEVVIEVAQLAPAETDGAPTDEAPTDEAKPKRKRAATPRAGTTATTDAAAPKAPTRRRKTAEPVGEPGGELDAAAEGEASGEVAAKPKRKRTPAVKAAAGDAPPAAPRRRKAPAKAADEAADQAAPAAQAETPPSALPALVEAERATAVTETPEAPVLEAPAPTPVVEEAPQPSGPPKRGWWNRLMSGDE